MKLQRKLIAENTRVLIIFEGRDGAGKDGAIQRLTENMSPRETRVHAPGKPSNREESEWYFQRFARYFPAGGEFVIFNRSWPEFMAMSWIWPVLVTIAHDTFAACGALEKKTGIEYRIARFTAPDFNCAESGI